VYVAQGEKLAPRWLMLYAPSALHLAVNAQVSVMLVQAWLSICQSPRSYMPEQATGG
jgi:hypothetical protein